MKKVEKTYSVNTVAYVKHIFRTEAEKVIN